MSTQTHTQTHAHIGTQPQTQIPLTDPFQSHNDTHTQPDVPFGDPLTDPFKTLMGHQFGYQDGAYFSHYADPSSYSAQLARIFWTPYGSQHGASIVTPMSHPFTGFVPSHPHMSQPPTGFVPSHPQMSQSYTGFVPSNPHMSQPLMRFASFSRPPLPQFGETSATGAVRQRARHSTDGIARHRERRVGVQPPLVYTPDSPYFYRRHIHLGQPRERPETNAEDEDHYDDGNDQDVGNEEGDE